ncbi:MULTISPECIES: hypothetical protein [Bosea]|jgi:hypothetical protein|uniref:Uncharacterized protein n=1 Tax=Bosea rubneri TaxID=3075434 RepID=A0ABU3S472_9HYPH|nr:MULTISPECIES: hypothetical protein [unclassified Bosea (in: a-proteobacteria)]MDU0339531.1 hypothetical protein [Bosea sp. ZW T0_25]HEV7337094.1 hypothetical protein [Bosea sp. (in: a-proteobacteria)]
MEQDVREREARIPTEGGQPIPPMRADKHTDADPAVETAVEARQGFLDRPVLMVLIGGLVLAVIAWIGVEIIAY